MITHSRGPTADAVLDYPPVLFLHAAMFHDSPSFSFMWASLLALPSCTHGVCRAPVADVVLDHPSISPPHAAVYYEDRLKAWHVADLGSVHGTFYTWPGWEEHLVEKVQSPEKW